MAIKTGKYLPFFRHNRQTGGLSLKFYTYAVQNFPPQTSQTRFQTFSRSHCVLSEERFIMTKRHHISVACCIGTVLCGCAALDEQMTGIASPEVAMYTAQIEFADAFCRNANLVDDPAKSQKYVTLVHNIMQVKDQRKYRPEFPVFYSDSHRKFSAAGSRMSSNEKNNSAPATAESLISFQRVYVLGIN